ncbi:unnamed protein product [Symbiodinium necroappetens]|uniref:Uncharacterized protein n=1 Tax=Symbiodinium necroappetens TaxID=1628268 RepID=A0A812TTT0_9DINO|nr:unnamed protein product [Symbiodinium necroappetens]
MVEVIRKDALLNTLTGRARNIKAPKPKPDVEKEPKKLKKKKNAAKEEKSKKSKKRAADDEVEEKPSKKRSRK